MATEWFYARGSKRMGPFSPRQLKDLADAGTIVPTDIVWKDDLKEGVLAGRVRNLFVRAASPTPAASDNASPPPEDAAATPPAAAPPIEKAPAPAIAETATTSGEPSSIDVPETISLVPLEPPAAPKPAPKPAAKPAERVKKGRATALKGADIVSQDGAYARYRKKCMKCGHQDSACHTLLITNKMFKTNFFCPKCRKGREVAIQCTIQ